MGQKFSRNRSILLHFRDKHVFVFYAEIQDVRQKWRENDFWGKSPVESSYTLWVKNFVEIALFRSVSEINAFLCLAQKYTMSAKSGGKTFFGEKLPVESSYIPCGSRILLKLLYLALFPR